MNPSTTPTPLGIHSNTSTDVRSATHDIKPVPATHSSDENTNPTSEPFPIDQSTETPSTDPTNEWTLRFLDDGAPALLPDFRTSHSATHTLPKRRGGVSRELVIRDLLAVSHTQLQHNKTSIRGAWSRDHLCIAVGDTVLVFDASATRHIATVSVGELITACTFSDNQSFLLIGDAAGAVHFIHIPTASLIHSRSIAPQGERIPIMWVSAVYSPFAGTETVFVVTDKRRLIKVSNLQFSELETAITTKDYELAKSLYAETEVEGVSLDQYGDFDFQCATYSCVTDCVYMASTPGSTYPLSVWGTPMNNECTKMLDYVNLPLHGTHVLKLECHPIHHLMFSLTDEHKLVVWDLHSLIIVNVVDSKHVLDFQVMGSIPSPSTATTKMDTGAEMFHLVLITKDLVTEETMLEVRDINTLKLSCSWKVCSDTLLMETMLYQGGGTLLTMMSNWRKTEQEDTAANFNSVGNTNASSMYDGAGLSAFFIRRDKEDIIVSLLSESPTIHRYYQLMSSLDFEAARKYALECDMDLQVLYKHQLVHMLETAHELPTVLQTDLDAIKDVLKNVDDIRLVCEFCERVTLNDLSAVQSLLKFAEDLLVQKEKDLDVINADLHRLDSPTTELSDDTHNNGFKVTHNTIVALKRELHRTSYKLSTFRLMQSATQANQISMNDSTDMSIGWQWGRFRVMTIGSYAVERFREGNLRVVSVLWSRHTVDCVLERAFESLTDLPLDIDKEYLRFVLCEYIIPSLTTEDEKMAILVWAQERTVFLELQKGAEKALAFLSMMFMKDDKSDTDRRRFRLASTWVGSLSPHTYVNNVATGLNQIQFGDCVLGTGSSTFIQSVAELKKVFTSLQDICYLETKHKFTISFDDYTLTTPQKIAKALIERVAAPELIMAATSNDLIPYATLHSLDSDDILREYCMDILNSMSVTRGGATQNASESRSIARVASVFPAIESDQVRSDVILLLMRTTPIPWEPFIGKLFEEAASLKSRLHQEIESQYTLLKLKHMLLKYKIDDFDVANKSQAWSLLPRILSQTTCSDALVDSMLIIKAYHNVSTMEVYRTRISYLLDESLLDDVSAILRPDNVELSALGDEFLLSKAEGIAICEELYWWKSDELDLEASRSQDETNKLSEFISIVRQMICLVECARNLRDTPSYVFRRSLNSERIQMRPSYTVFGDMDELLKILNCVLSLAVEHRIVRRVDEVDTEEKRIIVLSECGLETDDLQNVLKSSTIPVRDAKGKKAKSYDMESGMDDDQANSSTRLKEKLDRLGKVLLFSRGKVLQNMAMEAAKRGDIKLALTLGKEMAIDAEHEALGSTLQLLVEEVMVHLCKEQFWRLKTNQNEITVLTRTMRHFMQQVLLTCCAKDLPTFIRSFAWADIMNTVFLHSNAGSYEAMVTQRDAIPNRFSDEVAFSNIPSSVDFTTWAHKVLHKCKEEQLKLFTPMKDAGNLDISVICEGTYTPRIFVLDTTVVMPLIAKLSTACVKSLSRFKDNRPSSTSDYETFDAAFDDVVFACKDLIEHLVQYSNPRISLNVLYMTLMALYEFPEVMNKDDGANIMASAEKLYFLAINKLASDALSAKEIDRSLVIGCLLSLPMKESFSVFKSGITTSTLNYSRLCSIATVGIVVAIIWKQRAFRISCEELAQNAKWWQLLSLLKIPFQKEKFKYQMETEGHQLEIIPMLLRKTSYDIETCLAFARTYDIEEDVVYLQLIRSLLFEKGDFSRNGEFILSIVLNVCNKDKLYDVLSTECLLGIGPYDYDRISAVANTILAIRPNDELGRSCKAVVDVIRDYKRTSKPTIDELLEAKRLITSKTNTIDTSAQTSAQGSSSVFGSGKDLNSYTEAEDSPLSKLLSLQDSDISSMDHDALYSLLVSVFPESSSRLPYHSLVLEPWSVLQGEISESTLSRLTPLRRILGLNADVFYVIALDKMIVQRMQEKTNVPKSKKVGDSGQNEVYCTIPYVETRKLLVKIMDKKVAIRTALQLAVRYAPGSERIECYSFAYNTAKSVAGQKKEADLQPNFIENIKGKLLYAQVESHLVAANLSEFLSFMDVKDNAERLLVELYRQKSDIALSSSLDIHDLVRKICEVMSRDPDSFRRELIITLLRGPVELRSTFGVSNEQSLPSTRMQSLSPTERVVHLQLKYLLKSMPMQSSIELLLGYASAPQTSIPTVNRIRALRVLFELAPAETLTSEDDSDDIFVYSQMLLYLADFEELQIPQTLREFSSCDKQAFARSILLQYPDDMKCIQLVCNMCLDYGINDKALWETALKKLAAKKSFFYLLGLFSSLIDSDVFVTVSQLSFIQTLWVNTVLKVLQQCQESLDSSANLKRRLEDSADISGSATKKIKVSNSIAADSTSPDNEINSNVCLSVTEEIEEVLNQSISLIIKCPFLDDLDLKPLIKSIKLVADKLPHFHHPGWSILCQ